MGSLALVFRLAPETEQQLNRIEQKLDQLLCQEMKMKIDLTALLAAVERETSVEKSALALIAQMAGQMADISKQLADAIASNDPAALAAVQAQVDSAVKTLTDNDDELAGAVTANTPAAPAAPPAAPTGGSSVG